MHVLFTSDECYTYPYSNTIHKYVVLQLIHNSINWVGEIFPRPVVRGLLYNVVFGAVLTVKENIVGFSESESLRPAPVSNLRSKMFE